MKQFVLAAALLLVGCGEPPHLSVSNSPQILNGRWTGTLYQDMDAALIGSGMGRVYLLQVDNKALTGGQSHKLLALDAASGAVLASAPIETSIGVYPPETAFAYRRDGVLLETTPDGTLELSGETLQPTAQHPGVTGRLSRDGTAVVGDSTLTDTESWQARPLAVTPTDEALSSDGRWQAGGDGRVVNLLTGVAFSLNPQHALACPVSGGLGSIPFDNDGDGLAIGYVDGRLERRDARGNLVATLTASGDCRHAVQGLMQQNGQLLVLTSAFAGTSIYPQDQLLTVNETSGQATTLIELDGEQQDFPQLTPEGVALHSPADAVVALRFVTLDGVAWSLDRPALPLDLSATATFVDDSHYRSQGTVELEGRSLWFQLEAQAAGVVLTQDVPPRVSYRADLSDAQGLYGQLGGFHATAVAQFISVERASDGLAFSGTLTRP